MFNSQASDVSEDTVAVTWSFPDGTQIEGNFGQYQFTDDGEFLIGVTAEDEDGGRTSESLLINIENVAPTFTEFKIPSEAQEGEALDFTFEATDPGVTQACIFYKWRYDRSYHVLNETQLRLCQ